MLVDSYQRFGMCCGSYWPFIVLFMPGGEFAYFLMVKIHDPEFSSFFKKIFKKRVTLDQLRFEAEHCPSEHNKLILGLALCDERKYQEALTIFESLSSRDSNNKELIYGQGVSKLGLDRIEEALSDLNHVLELDFAFKDYQVASETALIYRKLGQKDRALEILKRIDQSSRDLKHSLVFAKILIEAGDKEQAKNVLSSRLKECEHVAAKWKKVPWGVKSEAKQLLKTI